MVLKKRSDLDTFRSSDKNDLDLLRKKMYQMYEEQFVSTLVFLKKSLMEEGMIFQTKVPSKTSKKITVMHGS